MQFSTYALVAILAATANAAIPKKGDHPKIHHPSNETAVWTTETVTAYKTWCPESTTFVKDKHTYTAT